MFMPILSLAATPTAANATESRLKDVLATYSTAKNRRNSQPAKIRQKSLVNLT
jgi:hypothetical protein